MEIELEPDQPDDVIRAVRALLAEPVRRLDPWWAAGLEPVRAQGEATAPPRSTRGAERA